MKQDIALPLRARIARAFRFLSFIPGWRRLVGAFVPVRSGRFVVTNGGTTFSGDFASFLDREIYLFGSYEGKLIQRFLRMAPEARRSVILDVGANAGNHTLSFARCFATVHSFEPNPMLWDQFESNVVLNGVSNRVTLHKIGLADRDEALKLFLIDKPNLGLGTFSTIEQYDLPLVPAADCEVKNGSRYLSSIGISRVDAVKIDVQGFEPEVLRGLRDVLERDRPALWVEIGPGTRSQVSILSDLSKLVPYDFRCHLIDGKRVTEVEGAGADLPAGNYVLTPT